MGYSPSHKGYKCLVIDGRLHISKNVIFNELSFPYPTLFPKPSLITFDVPDSTPTLTILSNNQPSLASNPTTQPSIPNHTSVSSSSSQHLLSSLIVPSEQNDSLSIQPNTILNTDKDSPVIPSSIDLALERPLNTYPICILAKFGIVKPRINLTLLSAHLEPKLSKLP